MPKQPDKPKLEGPVLKDHRRLFGSRWGRPFLNSVMLMGVVTREPIVRKVKDPDDPDHMVAKLQLFCPPKFGYERQRNLLLWCDAFGDLAKFAAKNIHARDHVLVTGELQNDSYYSKKKDRQIDGVCVKVESLSVVPVVPRAELHHYRLLHNRDLKRHGIQVSEEDFPIDEATIREVLEAQVEDLGLDPSSIDDLIERLKQG